MEMILRTAMQAVSFLIFQTVLLHLVEQSRYARYIRVFSGFLLILVLISKVSSFQSGEDLIGQVEKQAAWRLEESDLRMQLQQAEDGRREQIRDEMEKRILTEAEQVLAEERFFLREGYVEFTEEERISAICLNVSRTRTGEESREHDSLSIRVEPVEKVEPIRTEPETDPEEKQENGEPDGEAERLASRVAGRMGIPVSRVCLVILE